MMCSACQAKPVAPNRTKYCSDCAASASVLWKRRQRRAWKQSGQKYWRDNWKHKSDQERRAYYRAYMRTYRARKQRENALFASSLTRQQPLNPLSKSPRDPHQDIGPDLTLPFFVPGQLSLADPKLPGEGCLSRIEAAELAEAPSSGLPVNDSPLRLDAHEDFS